MWSGESLRGGGAEESPLVVFRSRGRRARGGWTGGLVKGSGETGW